MKLSAPHRRRLCRFFPLPAEESRSSVSRLNATEPPAFRGRCFARCKRARLRFLHLAAAGAVLLGISLPAWASLGGNVDSVESDRVQMKAGVQVTQHAAYNVHEIQMPGGTMVDEYVSPAGTVFAVTWRGQFPPPMQQILGTYFPQYSAALQAQPKFFGHRPLSIQQQGLVVQAGGHMRAHFGRAYDPGLLPQGVSVGELQ